MKKLVTIAKSKFYMLKVAYPDVVEQVMTEMAETVQDDASDGAAARLGDEAPQNSQKLDLKFDSKASSQEFVNVAETEEESSEAGET